MFSLNMVAEVQLKFLHARLAPSFLLGPCSKVPLERPSLTASPDKIGSVQGGMAIDPHLNYSILCLATLFTHVLFYFLFLALLYLT